MLFRDLLPRALGRERLPHAHADECLVRVELDQLFLASLRPRSRKLLQSTRAVLTAPLQRRAQAMPAQGGRALQQLIGAIELTHREQSLGLVQPIAGLGKIG